MEQKRSLVLLSADSDRSETPVGICTLTAKDIPHLDQIRNSLERLPESHLANHCGIAGLRCEISEMGKTGSVKKEKPHTAGAMRGFRWPVSAEALTETS